jgi:lipopolysaccharide export system permease protein
MPIALFLGVTLALARLNRDGEMAALAACGVGTGRLLVPIGGLALLLAAALGWLALVATPTASQRIEEIRFRAEQDVELEAVEAGKFTSPDSGDTVLYAREVVGDELRDVFVETQQDERVVVVLAARGRRLIDTTSGEQSFVLYDGKRYEGVPGQGEFLVLEFGEHGLPVRGEDDDEFVTVPAAKPTPELVRSIRPADRAELHWRLSMPVSLLVLGLLAIPLSRTSPREGRYARFGIALMIYVIYTNLLSIGRVWLERGVVGDAVGLWWVHAIAGLVALWMFAREGGWFVRARAPRPVAA